MTTISIDTPIENEAIASRLDSLLDAFCFIEECFGIEIAAREELLPKRYLDGEQLVLRLAHEGRKEIGHCLESLEELTALIKEDQGSLEGKR